MIYRKHVSDSETIFQGVVPASRQSAFMEHLIDLVYIADTAEDPKNKLFREAGVVRYEPLYGKNSHYYHIVERKETVDLTYLFYVIGMNIFCI